MDELFLTEDERTLVDFILNTIPAADKDGITDAKVIAVLDLMDEFLASKNLVIEDKEQGEITYLEGEIDEGEQLDFIIDNMQQKGIELSAVQIQLIIDAELQYGIQEGYYIEEED